MLHKNILLMVDDLRKDNTSGASEFIVKALSIIETYLDTIESQHLDIKNDFLALSKEIMGSRPSMAPLINMIGYLIQEIQNFTKHEIKKKLENYRAFRNEMLDKLEINFNQFIHSYEKDTIGIMLISYSSTIINLLENLTGKTLDIYVLESRPLLEGHLVAERLSSKYKTSLIIDAAMGFFIKDIDLVLIGVDSILSNGSIINKIGTYPLCVLAKSNNKDVFIVADTHKVNIKSYYGENLEIEKKPTKEIYNKSLHKGLSVHNYYFDYTPVEYLSGIISNLGILLMEEFISKANSVLPKKWFEDFL